ncbi:unnamed protein product, partial [Mesorhabditis belari]|uniref:Apyrase n=1 Tax=Mesorhabditis belari TaxID=2138241 RepID=A0AAF3FJ15_9BILA
MSFLEILLSTRAWALLGVVILLLLITFVQLSWHLQDLKDFQTVLDQRPLSPPIRTPDGFEYKIAVVTDLDTFSKMQDDAQMWRSYLKTGSLKLSDDWLKASVTWNDGKSTELKSKFSVGGRGMELSDLVVFDRKLLTIDDRTGIVYQIKGNSMIPFVILGNGPGNVSDPLKGEWMTVKDEYLYVGGLGKEWTSVKGEFINDFPMWVKQIDRFGRVIHHNWASVYRKVRESVGIKSPGYMIHEAVQWSKVHRKWFFLPRRASNESYDDTKDELRGTNMLITLDEEFENPRMVRVGKTTPKSYKGFSAFQFVPGTEDLIIAAVKSEEKEAQPVGSHLTIFNVGGAVILEDQKIDGPYKFEGIAFI